MNMPTRIFIAMVALMVMGLTTVACTPGQLVGAVKKVEVSLQIAKNLLPEAQALLNGLELDPAVAADIQKALNEAGPGIDGLKVKCDAFLANPGETEFQALLNAFYAFSSDVNSKATLIALRIKNPDAQKQATAWYSRFSTVFTVSLSILQAVSTQKPQTKTARLLPGEQRALFNRAYAHEVLLRMGYAEETARSYAGL